MSKNKVKKIKLSKEESKELENILGNSEVLFNNETENMEAEAAINNIIDQQPESPLHDPISQEARKEMHQAFLQMKKLLKPRSKGELIELVWTYGVQLQELQHACQILLEENKELKGHSND